jgi:hypothetical protein
MDSLGDDGEDDDCDGSVVNVDHTIDCTIDSMTFDNGAAYRSDNPLPTVNVPSYRQEKLSGHRARKFTLKALFGNCIDLPSP